MSSHFLWIDYYRIRKKLALPLPIDALPVTWPKVRDFALPYPWATWLLWALEERITSLGEYALQSSDAKVYTVLARDVSALANWPDYRASAQPDLPFAHAVRVLWRAATRWHGLNAEVREQVHTALHRAIADALPFSDILHSIFDSTQAVLAAPEPHKYLHNIPVIGACALAIAANTVQHPAAGRLNAQVWMLLESVLCLRTQGLTEGVSYDGYVLDFVADWLDSVDPALRAQVLVHPALPSMLEQVLEVAVPGDVMNSAPLGDVEPTHMPFVWSALTKLQAWLPNARVQSALAQCVPQRLRSDALAALAQMDVAVNGFESVVSIPTLTHYTLTLRSSGHDANDMAVVIGLNYSPMGHIQCDNGTLVLGRRGRWWIDDPGYQQYLKTNERKFTLGANAHNAPVINGQYQTLKQPTLLAMECLADATNVQFGLIDLTACYPPKARVERVLRGVWLLGNQHVVVCDLLDMQFGDSLSYSWHGHPDLFWCMEDGMAVLASEQDVDCPLHIFSPQVSLCAADLHRLPGSRGQQSLVLTLFPPQIAAVWWVFSFAEQRPIVIIKNNEVMVDEYHLPLLKFLQAWGDAPTSAFSAFLPLSRQVPLQVNAERKGNHITATCQVGEGHFEGILEYAFYLMSDEKKLAVRWYMEDPIVHFDVPMDYAAKRLVVRGFVREKENPDRKKVVNCRV